MRENAIHPELPLLAAVAVMPLVVVPGLKDSYLLPKLFWSSLCVLAALLLELRRSIASPKERFGWVGIELPILSFLAIASISAALSIDSWPSWVGPYGYYVFGLFGWWICAAALLAAVWQGLGEGFAGRLSLCLVAACIPVSLYALAQALGLEPFLSMPLSRVLGGEGRPISSIGGPIPLGAFLMMALPPAGLMIASRNGNDRVLGAAGFALGALALAATRARAAWLGAFAGVGFAFWLGGMLSRRSALALAALMLVCAGGFLWMRPRRIASDGARRVIWRSAIQAFADHPLLGVGPGAFGAAFRLYRGPEYDRALGGPGLTGEIQHDAHNDWLQILSTMGFAGVVAYAWCHAAVLAQLCSLGPRLKGAHAGLAGGLAALFIQSKFNGPGWPAMFVAAVSLGCLLRGAARRLEIPKLWIVGALTGFAALLAVGGAWLVAADLQAGAGLALRAQGRPRSAAERQERAIAINPFETSYRLDLNNLLWDVASDIPDAGAKREVLARAGQLGLEAVLRRPGDAEAYRLLGLAEMKRYELGGEDRLAAAGAALDAASRLNPTFSLLRQDREHLDELVKKKKRR